ncbi:TPA: hypothetical protein ACT0TC_002983 [Klebsiella aerogenes]
MTKSTITRERAEQLANFKGAPVTRQEEQELARIALAAMDSEPVMYQARMWNPEYEEWDPWAECNENAFVVFSQEADRGEGMEVRKLYAAPQPAPVVPEEATPDSIEILASARRRDHAVFQWDEDQRNAAADSWNAFRAAILQAINSPVIGIDPASGPDRTVEVRYVAPPGYVMVPKEPTERMVIDGVESEPDETFSESEVWEAYQKMSGCEQAAFRARLCWATMLAAVPPAPTQENF